jgi:MinD-like ATPase involved in chromosome partitioning or flagellar assembly
MQQPVSTGRRIAVLSAGGGTGASTLAALVALSLASVRQDVVSLLDVGSVFSAAPSMTGLDAVSPRAVLGLLSVRAPQSRAGFLEALSVPPGRPPLVAATAAEPPLDSDGCRSLISEFSRHSAVCVLDAPGGVDDARTRAILDSAHCVALVAEPTQSGALKAQATLAALRETAPGLRVLLVTNERARRDPRARSALRELVRSNALAAAAVSHARRLRGNEPLSVDGVSEKTRAEIFALASSLVTLSR